MGRLRYNFSGETVLVTGASRGIGRAVAEGFAAAGANVTILSSGAGIHETAREIASRFGRPVRAIECDITDSAVVPAMCISPSLERTSGRRATSRAEPFAPSRP